MTYQDKLQHPKWQRRRLEVFQNAQFRCEQCGNDQITLCVHHRYYERGREPWDYPDCALYCLCRDCHSQVHDYRQWLIDLVGALTPGMTVRIAKMLFTICELFEATSRGICEDRNTQLAGAIEVGLGHAKTKEYIDFIRLALRFHR